MSWWFFRRGDYLKKAKIVRDLAICFFDRSRVAIDLDVSKEVVNDLVALHEKSFLDIRGITKLVGQKKMDEALYWLSLGRKVGFKLTTEGCNIVSSKTHKIRHVDIHEFVKRFQGNDSAI